MIKVKLADNSCKHNISKSSKDEWFIFISLQVSGVLT